MEKEFEGSVTGLGSAETQCERVTDECAETGGNRQERHSRLRPMGDEGVTLDAGRWDVRR
jgi:hypothetical protein